MLARIAFSTLLATCAIGTTASQDIGALARLDLAEIFRIGDDESGDVVFGFISALDVNAAGQIIAADGMSNSVYIFSGSGDLVDVIGRSGSGPGEFEDISGLYVGPEDSVYVLDSDIYRLSVFEPETYRYAYSFGVERAGVSEPAQLLGVVENRFVVVYRSPMTPDFGGAYDRRAIVNLVSRQGEVIGAPVVSLPDWEYAVSRHHTLLIPFGRRFKYHFCADGLVYSGLNDAIDIRITTIEGDTREVIRFDHPTVPVTRDDVTEYVRDMSPEARRLIMASSLPTTMPAYKTFTVDDQGHIWVQRIGKGGTPSGEWLLLSEEGKAVAKAILPVSESLYVIREGIAYGSGKSDSGAPYIVAYRIDE